MMPPAGRKRDGSAHRPGGLSCSPVMSAVLSFETLAIVHLAATGFMVGLIWTIHVVHYPLFALVNEPYRPFQEAHMARITALLVLPWGIEVVSAALLILAAPRGSATTIAVLGVGLVGLLVAITGLGAAPIHGRLVEQFDADLHRRLLRVDRVRALLWTVRLAPATALLTFA